MRLNHRTPPRLGPPSKRLMGDVGDDTSYCMKRVRVPCLCRSAPALVDLSVAYVDGNGWRHRVSGWWCGRCHVRGIRNHEVRFSPRARVHIACAHRRLPLVCRIRGAQYNQRVGYVGEHLSTVGLAIAEPRDLIQTACVDRRQSNLGHGWRLWLLPCCGQRLLVRPVDSTMTALLLPTVGCLRGCRLRGAVKLEQPKNY